MNIEKLDDYIGRLQANRSPGALGAWGGRDEEQGGVANAGIELAMLQLAAHLSSMRPGANRAEAGFVSRLKSRVLAEATVGTDLAG